MRTIRKTIAPALALCLLFICGGCGAAGESSSLLETGTTTTVLAPETVAPRPPQESAPQGRETDGEAEEFSKEPEMQSTLGTAQPLPEEVVARMVGGSWKEDSPVALEDLAYLAIPYKDFAGENQLGEMVVRADLADEVLEIFAEIYEAGFAIDHMVLIDDYGADDLLSMAANNSSAFCSRLILGTDRYSVHSYGAAIDINPVQNPYVTGGEVYPEAAGEYMDRADARPGMVVEGDAVYTAFTSRGWIWGGHWPNPDYQHFEKDI